MKNEKGITLIALIITIIVMLILVGVTINVAIQGGLFGTAKDATQKMGREISREKLMAAMVGAYDSNGFFVKANVVLPEGMSWDTENSNCVLDENNEKFYIDPNTGEVLDDVPSETDELEYGVGYFAEVENVKLIVYLINDDLCTLELYNNNVLVENVFSNLSNFGISISGNSVLYNADENTTIPLTKDTSLRKILPYNPTLDTNVGLYKNALYCYDDGAGNKTYILTTDDMLYCEVDVDDKCSLDNIDTGKFTIVSNTEITYHKYDEQDKTFIFVTKDQF